MKFNRKVLAGITAAGLILGTTGAAHADNVQTDANSVITDTGPARQETIIAGGAGTVVTYFIQDTAANGCDITAATVNIAVPTGVTATGTSLSSSNSLSFTGCGTANTGQSVTFNSTTPGSYSVDHTTSGVTFQSTGNRSLNANAANFTLQVNAAAPTAVAPTVSGALSSAPNAAGWHKAGPVSLTWTVTGTPTPTLTGCVDQTIIADQAKTTYSCTAQNTAATVGPVTREIGLDSVAPVVTVTGVENGATYFLGSVPNAGCNTTDALSGVATFASLETPAPDHSMAGSKTASCIGAADAAGNTGSASATYTVMERTSAGFKSPVRLGTDVVNQIKGGSTVPLKFEIFETDGTTSTKATDASILTFGVVKYTCDNSDASIEVVTGDLSTGNTSLRYDTTDNQFIQNWKTPTVKNACYRATIVIPGGKAITAQFQTK